MPGIVSYTTYTGDLNGFQLDPRSVALDYEGLQLRREFYAPKYETAKQRLCDFDGVITDNRVWVDQDGHETVAAYRSDSVRVKQLRAIGIEVMILSSEPNCVVEARARKMGVEAVHGVALHDKGRVMREIIEQKNLKAGNSSSSAMTSTTCPALKRLAGPSPSPMPSRISSVPRTMYSARAADMARCARYAI